MHQGGGIKGKASRGRHQGGGIGEEASGRRHLEETSLERQSGGGIIEEASRGESRKRNPEGEITEEESWRRDH